MESLKGRRVAVLLTDGFEESEMTSPREALERAGAKCVLISNKDKVQAFRHHDKSNSFDVDLPLARADANDFDAVLLPGGVINADALRMEKKAQQFVQEMDRAEKPILVICHGSWLLVSSDLMEGRTITSWPTLQDDIRNAGGTWEDKECIRDRNWVSSRKPDDLPAFNRESIAILSEIRPGARQGTRAGESAGVRS